MSLATYIGEDDRDIGSIQIYDRGEKRLALLPKSHGYREPYTGLLDIPLIRSILDIEDKRYAEHSGIDIIGKI